jgi:hypothetical protein
MQARRAERQQRFAADLAAMKKPNSSILEQQDECIGSAGGWLALGGGYGSSKSLEKEYLRLTSVPKAEDVRPPDVLVQSLALIKRRWREGCSYAWACSQLKSVRQDLTVQVGGWLTWHEDGAAAAPLSSAKPATAAAATWLAGGCCVGPDAEESRTYVMFLGVQLRVLIPTRTCLAIWCACSSHCCGSIAHAHAGCR